MIQSVKQWLFVKILKLRDLKTKWHYLMMRSNPNYCKYHRVLSHPIEKCWVFKEKIMALAREGKIELADSTASTNQITTLQQNEPF
ncbi:unnamed protein product, partial [Cuscuta europaea]